MKFTRLSTYVLTLMAVAVLWSCGSSPKDTTKTSDFGPASDTTAKRIIQVAYNIPSPTEIPYLIQSTGAEFNQSLINDRKKAEAYSLRQDKGALNLGVYAADIGYLSSYDKHQEAINYLNTVKGIADHLGIVGSFDVELLKKFEANIANKDSLGRLIDAAVQQSQSYLKDESHNKLAALLITGGYVEGLFISTGLIKSYPKDLLPADQRTLILTPLIRVILEQKKSVDELIQMLATVDQAEPVASIVADLKVLQANYTTLNIDEKIKNNNSNLVLSDKNLIEITKIVEKLRKSIVE